MFVLGQEREGRLICVVVVDASDRGKTDKNHKQSVAASLPLYLSHSPFIHPLFSASLFYIPASLPPFSCSVPPLSLSLLSPPSLSLPVSLSGVLCLLIALGFAV